MISVDLGEKVRQADTGPCTVTLYCCVRVVTVTGTAGREGTARMQENDVKKPSHLDKELKCSASKPPDIILAILNPKGSMTYLIQPLTWFNELIQQSLKFSWPASVLSIQHLFFFPLFQSQPSVKSPVPSSPVPNLGRVHGEERSFLEKSFSKSPLCTS